MQPHHTYQVDDEFEEMDHEEEDVMNASQRQAFLDNLSRRENKLKDGGLTGND